MITVESKVVGKIVQVNLFEGDEGSEVQVGHVLVDILPNDCAEINGLLVNEKHRGKGYGRLLVNQAINQAIADGCDIITAHVEPDNIASSRVFQHHGFTTTTLEAHLELKLSPAPLIP